MVRKICHRDISLSLVWHDDANVDSRSCFIAGPHVCHHGWPCAMVYSTNRLTDYKRCDLM